MAIRVLLADDHSVVRQGLRMFLALDSEIEVVAEATDGAEAVELARQHRPDVVVMDLLMPGWTALSPLPRSGVKCLRSRCWLSPAS
jgi:DNA-binding NarL/FixJ family response regulator